MWGTSSLVIQQKLNLDITSAFQHYDLGLFLGFDFSHENEFSFITFHIYS